MAVSGDSKLRLMVMTSLAMCWRVVVPAISGGNMHWFLSLFLSLSLSLSHFFFSLTSEFYFLVAKGEINVEVGIYRQIIVLQVNAYDLAG